MPRISIVVPNFNKGNYIRETLESIKNQTFTDWECIVVDDGSDDDSIAVISDFVSNDNRFLLIRRTVETKGGSSCRNIGLTNATGEFIVFFDSDDLMLPGFLEHRYKIINASPLLDFAVFSTGTFVDKIGDSKDVWKVRENNHLNEFLSFALPWNIMSPIWRKKILVKLNGFDVNFPLLQDGEMHTRALLLPGVSYKVYPDAAPDCFYRINFVRKGHTILTQLELHSKGALMYIRRISEILIEKKKTDKLKYLKGTAFALITHFLWLYVTKKLTEQEFNDILNKLLSELEHIPTVFGRNHKRFLALYIKLYKNGLYQLKGFNYLSKKIYIHFF